MTHKLVCPRHKAPGFWLEVREWKYNHDSSGSRTILLVVVGVSSAKEDRLNLADGLLEVLVALEEGTTTGVCKGIDVGWRGG